MNGRKHELNRLNRLTTTPSLVLLHADEFGHVDDHDDASVAQDGRAGDGGYLLEVIAQRLDDDLFLAHNASTTSPRR